MTKIEIINETANFYTTKNRGVDVWTGNCIYLDPNTGNKCAFGRCIQDDKIDLFTNEALGGDLVGVPGIFGKSLAGKAGKYAGENHDDFLKEQYHGHSLDFWTDIQMFHDGAYWTETGLNSYGEDMRDRLLAKWSD